MALNHLNKNSNWSPIKLIEAAFSPDSMMKLYRTKIPKLPVAKRDDYFATSNSGLSISTMRVEETDRSPYIWYDIEQNEIHRILNIMATSETMQHRRSTLKQLLAEFGFAVEFDFTLKSGGRAAIPPEFISLIAPYWIQWVFSAYDSLVSIGYAVLAFTVRDDIIRGVKLPIPNNVIPNRVNIKISDVGGMICYELLDSALDVYKEAFIIVQTLPGVGHSYDFKFMHDKPYEGAAIQTPMATLISRYLRLQKFMRQEDTALEMGAHPVIITQYPQSSSLAGSEFITSTPTSKFKLSFEKETSVDDATTAVAKILPFVKMQEDQLTFRAKQPTDRMAARLIELKDGQQFAHGIFPARDFSVDIVQSTIDEIVTKFSGYPAVEASAISSHALPTLPPKIAGKTGSSTNVGSKSKSSASGSATSSSSKSKAGGSDGGGSGAGSSSSSSQYASSTFFTIIEDLMTVGWNIAFGAKNAELAFQILSALHTLFPGAVEDVHVNATKRIVIPRVRLLVPPLPTGNFEQLFKYLPESASLWPMSFGITPRSFQRIKAFNSAYPEFTESMDNEQITEDTMHQDDKKELQKQEKEKEKDKEKKKKEKEKKDKQKEKKAKKEAESSKDASKKTNKEKKPKSKQKAEKK